MRIRLQDGSVREIEPSDEELLAVIEHSLDRIRARSSFVECEVCGRRILVNNQDFHEVRQCGNHA